MPDTPLVGARILLVEDDAVLRNLMAQNLLARSHDVCSTEDASTALAHLRSRTFDLVILDINLPDQSGWEVLRTAMREGTLSPPSIDDEHRVLPVVILSAVRVSQHYLTEFRPLAYLRKPFALSALLRLAAEAALRREGNTHAV